MPLLTLWMFSLLSYSAHRALLTLPCAPNRAPPARNVSAFPHLHSHSPHHVTGTVSHTMQILCFVLFMIESNTLKSFYLLKIPVTKLCADQLLNKHTLDHWLNYTKTVRTDRTKEPGLKNNNKNQTNKIRD